MTNNVAKIKDFIIDRTSYNDIQTTKSNIQDGINESRKVTRLRDGKKMYVQYMIGDNYDCLDPQTKEELGRYTKSEIKLGW
jgi:hypothetical protein